MHRMVSDGLNGNSRVKNAQKVREYNPNSTPRIGDGVAITECLRQTHAYLPLEVPQGEMLRRSDARHGYK